MALCVLLCVLVWVGVGGLDIPPSSTSTSETSGIGAAWAPDGGGGGGLPDEGGVPNGGGMAGQSCGFFIVVCCSMLGWAAPRLGSLADSRSMGGWLCDILFPQRTVRLCG